MANISPQAKMLTQIGLIRGQLLGQQRRPHRAAQSSPLRKRGCPGTIWSPGHRRWPSWPCLAARRTCHPSGVAASVLAAARRLLGAYQPHGPALFGRGMLLLLGSCIAASGRLGRRAAASRPQRALGFARPPFRRWLTSLTSRGCSLAVASLLASLGPYLAAGELLASSRRI